jgi:ABC-type transport system substrate-binding protein
MATHNKKRSFFLITLFFFSIFLISAKFSTAEDVIPFVVATSNGPSKLDPLDAYDSVSIETIMQVVEGLYIHNYSSSEMEVIPCLASELGTWSPDMKNLTISLKQGVIFHDGTPFNAEMAKWNFDRLQYWTYGFDVDGDGDLEVHPLGIAARNLFKIGDDVVLNKTEVLGDFIIRFVLNIPCVTWEKLLAYVTCSIVKPDLDGESAPWMDPNGHFFNRIKVNDQLIGTGPFILTEYAFDNQVEFDYNPNYHETWGSDHIKKMIYLIIPDAVTSSLAILNHEIHWGTVLSEYEEQFGADPDLVEIRVKEAVVYYVQMNLLTMSHDIRYASSFAWNHTYWLYETLGGRHYELHVPVPDGMQYHHSGFLGEPEYDLVEARNILLSTTETDLLTNITASGLTASSTRSQWRAVAESVTPIAWFNFTRYISTTVYYAALQLQDNLKDIGIRLEILYPIEWCDWVFKYLENPDGPQKLAFSFGGWGPDFNDPIEMIEPLYGINASNNCFGLNNATWNQKLIDTYSAQGLARQNLFYEIQEDFCKIFAPSFYILQIGGTIGFNREYIDEDSVGDMMNILGDWYWFNVRFTPLDSPSPWPDPDPEPGPDNPFEIPGYEIYTLLGISLAMTFFFVYFLCKRYKIHLH